MLNRLFISLPKHTVHATADGDQQGPRHQPVLPHKCSVLPAISQRSRLDVVHQRPGALADFQLEITGKLRTTSTVSASTGRGYSGTPALTTWSSHKLDESISLRLKANIFPLFLLVLPPIGTSSEPTPDPPRGYRPAAHRLHYSGNQVATHRQPPTHVLYLIAQTHLNGG